MLLKLVTASMLGIMCLAWIFPFTGEVFRSARLKYFLLFSSILLSVKIGRIWHWSLGLFISMLLFRCLFDYTHQGAIATAYILLTIFVVPEFLKNISLKVFGSVIIFVALIHSFVAFLNVEGIYPFLPITNTYYAPLKPVIGLIGQHTLLVPFLVFALGFVAVELKKPIYWIFGAIIFLAIILCNSSMGFLSLAVFLCLYVTYHFGFTFFFGSVVLGELLASLVYIVSPGLFHGSGRAIIWANAWQLLEHKYWYGFGTGNWEYVGRKIALFKNRPEFWKHLHSDVYQAFFEFGIIGCIPLIIFVAIITKKSVSIIQGRCKERFPYIAGFFCLLANSLGNLTFHVVPYGFILMSCAWVIINDSSKKKYKTNCYK